MSEESKEIQIARINYKQAIIVAIISSIASILITLISTGKITTLETSKNMETSKNNDTPSSIYIVDKKTDVRIEKGCIGSPIVIHIAWYELSVGREYTYNLKIFNSKGEYVYQNEESFTPIKTQHEYPFEYNTYKKRDVTGDYLIQVFLNNNKKPAQKYFRFDTC